MSVNSESGASRSHGIHGYGIRNEEGDRILEFASAHELALANTYFIKKSGSPSNVCQRKSKIANRLLGGTTKGTQVREELQSDL